MLHGMNNVNGFETFEILSKLGRSEFTFHLTGSQFFETALETSDWDFFVHPSIDGEPEHGKLKIELEDMGFTQYINGYAYNDTSIAHIYRRYTRHPNNGYSGASLTGLDDEGEWDIDIQVLRSDAALQKKIKVNNWLKRHNLMFRAWPGSKRGLWDSLMDLA